MPVLDQHSHNAVISDRSQLQVDIHTLSLLSQRCLNISSVLVKVATQCYACSVSVLPQKYLNIIQSCPTPMLLLWVLSQTNIFYAWYFSLTSLASRIHLRMVSASPWHLVCGVLLVPQQHLSSSAPPQVEQLSMKLLVTVLESCLLVFLPHHIRFTRASIVSQHYVLGTPPQHYLH